MLHQELTVLHMYIIFMVTTLQWLQNIMTILSISFSLNLSCSPSTVSCFASFLKVCNCAFSIWTEYIVHCDNQTSLLFTSIMCWGPEPGQSPDQCSLRNSWLDILRHHHCFLSKMTSEKQLQKFHTLMMRHYWVVLLIGWSKFSLCHNQSHTLARSG